MIRPRRLLLAAIPTVGLTIVGCVRFNTYYNARRAFAEAEQLAAVRVPGSSPSSQELSLLDRCLEKCAVIIARHPESSLADDALFLMARALSLKEQHGAAAQKYAELREFFPSSDLVSATLFYEADARSKLGEWDAVDALVDAHLAPSDSWDDWQERSALLSAEAAEQQGDCEEVLARLAVLLEKTDRRAITCPAFLLRGHCLVTLGRTEESIRSFDEADRVAPSRQLRFKARLQRGEAFAQMGNGVKALAAFERLQQLARADSELAQVGLAIGRSYRALGDGMAAESAWRNVILAYPREQASREARMELASMLERDRRDLAAALVEYEELSKQGTPRLLVEEAGRRAKALREVERLRSVLSDSLASDAKALIDLAEIFLLQLQLPDSARPLLLRIGAEYPDSAWAARAIYAASWVSLTRGDTSMADSLARVLVERHPNSRHARAVRAGWGDLPMTAWDTSTPSWMYRQGEQAWRHDGDAERAAAWFTAVVDSFPDSPEAPAALLALAWVSSEAYDDTARARAYLSEAASRHPSSDEGKWAAHAVGMSTAAGTQPYDTPPFLVRIDTVACGEIAPVDTLHRLGNAMVRVLVDTTGTPRDVELVKSTGSLLCDDAALGAARMADYAAARKGEAGVQAWLDVSVPFIPSGERSQPGDST